MIGAIVWLIAAIVSFSGHFTLQPNEARLLILFGSYKGTVLPQRLHWANPFIARPRQDFEDGGPPSRSEALTSIGIGRQGGSATSPRRSRCAHNFNSEKLKVNDKRGNPVEIAAVIVWRVDVRRRPRRRRGLPELRAGAERSCDPQHCERVRVRPR